MSSVEDLLYLYHRPAEPIFLPRGEDKAVFAVPRSYVLDPYRFSINKVEFVKFRATASNDEGRKIPVKEITVPELGIASELSRSDNFSVFLPRHNKMAAHLIGILDGLTEYDDFLSACVYYHGRVNPQLYIYCLSVAIVHRPDTKNLQLPPLYEVFPEKFFPSSVFSRAREDAYVVPSGFRRSVLVDSPTASNLEPENRLAYFREDPGVNLHHWHWHLVYPTVGPLHIVNKDRRGELFFYMHSQIIARYNIERLSNGLGRVDRWNRWYEPIAEAYFPKLGTPLANHNLPGRQARSLLKDINRPLDKYVFDVHQLEMWRDRILYMIATGSYEKADRESVPLTEKDGIDILGNTIEATALSPNSSLYGNLHNSMHIALAFVHDPDHRYLEQAGVMADTTTAMRDPVFYRLHAWVEYVFQVYKQTLPAYPVEKLNNPGIDVTGVEILSRNPQINVLNTFWQQSDVDLSRGLNYAPRGSILTRVTHLQYTPYIYKIKVNNTSELKQFGTCRIFMAPKHDERELRDSPLEFTDQKSMMIELDKFTVTLKPGENTIAREAALSSVTIPFKRTFPYPPTDPSDEVADYCGCGWPQHMLLPKGTESGYDVVVFVMISNYADDKIDQDITGECTEGSSFCGIRNKKYPDARSMGYPFDRQPRAGVKYLSEFLTPNMKTVDVKIVHTDKILSKPTTEVLAF